MRRDEGLTTVSPYRSCGREDGSVLIATLLVLLAVTVLGVASINNSVVEMKIARAEKETRETFYRAEGAVMEGLQRLIAMDAVDKNEQFPFWYHSSESIKDGEIEFRDPARWDVDGMGEDNGLASGLDPDIFLAAVEWRVATGGSLIQTQSRLYQNRVYGLCKKYGINSIVEIGYDLRY
ncbi:PilX N-terminal domain-containing pilus assembly protein [Desulfatitalea tepidiphila]|uniref:PilX N-terminal domain-containing pilus assembly protein n=1 Tax=Desulfatitalea tepidiphila TaxID=1185843 RepID=UPI0006B45856|nr:PilX N-terminal domain-containing pilus assembly protein [Desulfatitalea tepidiphila]